MQKPSVTNEILKGTTNVIPVLGKCMQLRCCLNGLRVMTKLLQRLKGAREGTLCSRWKSEAHYR